MPNAPGGSQPDWFHRLPWYVKLAGIGVGAFLLNVSPWLPPLLQKIGVTIGTVSLFALIIGFWWHLNNETKGMGNWVKRSIHAGGVVVLLLTIVTVVYALEYKAPESPNQSQTVIAQPAGDHLPQSTAQSPTNTDEASGISPQKPGKHPPEERDATPQLPSMGDCNAVAIGDHNKQEVNCGPPRTKRGVYVNGNKIGAVCDDWPDPKINEVARTVDFGCLSTEGYLDQPTQDLEFQNLSLHCKNPGGNGVSFGGSMRATTKNVTCTILRTISVNVAR